MESAINCATWPCPWTSLTSLATRLHFQLCKLCDSRAVRKFPKLKDQNPDQLPLSLFKRRPKLAGTRWQVNVLSSRSLCMCSTVKGQESRSAGMELTGNFLLLLLLPLDATFYSLCQAEACLHTSTSCRNLYGCAHRHTHSHIHIAHSCIYSLLFSSYFFNGVTAL